MATGRSATATGDGEREVLLVDSLYTDVGQVRRAVEEHLVRTSAWVDLGGVLLVVSELVTNALRHGLPASAPPEADPPVRLHLMRWSSRLVCAVRDPSGEAPHAAAQEKEFDEMVGFADCTAESGRGLWLVDSFSDCWGWHRLTGALPGKVVWAMFRFGPAV